MKIRKGFVSNSSSSSFICDVCGENQSGMDIILSDCDMFKCQKGHTICNSHKIDVPFESLKEKYPDYFKDNDFKNEMIETMKSFLVIVLSV
jgi:hypothetical protein